MTNTNTKTTTKTTTETMPETMTETATKINSVLDLGPLASTTNDFDFLVGTWHVHHRRRPNPFDGASGWLEFDSVQQGRTYFNGAVSVDEISLAEPGERGLTVRTYDPAAKEWSIYWINSRIGRLEPPPMVGRFEGGIGTFFATEDMAGRSVDVRFTWSNISATTALWTQAFSLDSGMTWVDNWEMRFTRGQGA